MQAQPQAAAAAASPLSEREELANLRALHAQMQTAGQELQKRVASMEQEKAALVAAATLAATSKGPSPKGPTPSEFHGKTGSYEVDAWIRDMKVQFEFYRGRFPDEESKVRHAAMFLKGKAAEWWEAEDKSAGVLTSWDLFVERLHERYRPLQAAIVARERLRKLKQTGSVSAYADVFQRELTPIKDMSASDQVFNFIAGLSSSVVANKVREQEPATLHEAMVIAVRQDAFQTNHGSSRFSAFRGASAASSSTAMDVNNFQEEEYPAQDSDRVESKLTFPSSLLEQMEAMVQHRVAAMFQDRVPGLKASDIEKLRSEGRCFRCKQKGHSKRDCPKGSGVGKPSFQ